MVGGVGGWWLGGWVIAYWLEGGGAMEDTVLNEG